MGWSKVTYGVQVSVEDAFRLHRRFFHAYPGVAAWQREQRARVGNGSPITTPAGRVAHHLQAGAVGRGGSARPLIRQHALRVDGGKPILPNHLAFFLNFNPEP